MNFLGCLLIFIFGGIFFILALARQFFNLLFGVHALLPKVAKAPQTPSPTHIGLTQETPTENIAVAIQTHDNDAAVGKYLKKTKENTLTLRRCKPKSMTDYDYKVETRNLSFRVSTLIAKACQLTSYQNI